MPHSSLAVMNILVLIPVLILSVGCSAESAHLRRGGAGIESPRPVPRRVAATWTNYVALLRECDHERANTNEPTAIHVLDVIAPAVIASASSPLLDSDPVSSLSQVYALGEIVISNLLNGSVHIQERDSKLMDIYAWLAGGLRQEPSVSCWRFAIALDEKLLNAPNWQSGTSQFRAAILARATEQDFVPEVVGFVTTNIATLKGVKLYGTHDDACDKIIPRILKTLNTMRDQIKDYAQLKAEVLALRAMVASRPDSAKKDIVAAYLDLLLAEINLQERKSLFRGRSITNEDQTS